MKKVVLLLMALTLSACENSVLSEKEADKPKKNLTVKVLPSFASAKISIDRPMS